VAGDQGTEGAGGAADQGGGLGPRRLGNREHDLADVAALAHQTEGIGAAAHVPAGDRRHLQGVALEELDDLTQHRFDPLGAGFDQVIGAVGEVGMGGGELSGVADVGLADLQEATAAGEQLQAGVDELPRQ
jgi:hypothetical protein